MSEESDLEKDLPASERKIQQAREEGQVLRSRELAMTLVVLGSTIVLWSMRHTLWDKSEAIFKTAFRFSSIQLENLQVYWQDARNLCLMSLWLIVPFLMVSAVLAVLGNIALGGWNFTTQALMPKFSRINPLSGLKNVFGWQGVSELVKALLKSSLLGGVGVWLLWRDQGMIVDLPSANLSTAAAQLAMQALKFFTILAAIFIVITGVDVPFQWWRYYSQMKMSLEEYKREAKETEGDPHIKGRIRQQQREMARKRMMASIPKADVVVTNPTHYSVALQYDQTKNGAPRVVAKGKGDVALKIREIAAEHKVLMVEAPPLARALYAHVKLEQEIPSTLYAAVAQVLAYLFQLRSWQEGALLAKPDIPTDFLVPEGLDPHALPDFSHEDDTHDAEELEAIE